jgi:hypothetical protein
MNDKCRKAGIAGTLAKCVEKWLLNFLNFMLLSTSRIHLFISQKRIDTANN